MQPTTEALQTRLAPNLNFHDYAPGAESFRDAVLTGLGQAQKRIPFRFLYDAEGSRLFELICQQPEYYLTRTETRILKTHASDIAARAGTGAQLVELGSGAGEKVETLLAAFDRPASYIALDISRDALLAATKELAASTPHLKVHAVCADFSAPFRLPVQPAGRVVGFFPGSSLGNFEPHEARDFLALWARRLGRGGQMVIGIDLIKPAPVLERAYDDAAGVTAAFTLNILRRANRELKANFSLPHFRHLARFNAEAGAIEIFLVSEKAQEVAIGDRRFHFVEGEKIHIESSYKYDVPGFVDLARSAGFRSDKYWTDERGLFSVHFLSVET